MRTEREKLHSVWRQMIQRCHMPTARNYRWYGARGISVCDRWRGSFDAFLSDMGERPPGATLDRIDTSSGYSPGNCRWASWVDQANNRTSNKLLAYNGRSHTLAEWARIVGFSHGAIKLRLKRGWTVGQALEYEPRPTGPDRRPNRAPPVRAALALLLLLCAPAAAHRAPSGWEYDQACCSDLDCAPVPESAVVEATGGYIVRLVPGQHPMVRAPLAAFLAHGDSRIRVSGDEHRHACVSGSGRLLCIYVPPGGV
jgi:hypothetical protein